MTKDLISIVIPSYNAKKFIAETIDSVINQSYTNWELIIIDDGSTDNSKLIINEFCKADNRIKYYYQNNSGVSVARNNGIRKAKGKYIALLDADDVFEKENLKTKINILESNKNFHWVYSNNYYADENINIVKEGPKGTDQNILDSILLYKGEVVPGPCSNLVFLKKCFDEGVVFDQNFSTTADQDFTIQLASKFKGYYIDEPLWRYRILNNSMSRGIALMEKDQLAVFKKASKNKLFKNFWFEQQCYSNMYWIMAGSWWKNGDNKLRGIYFIILALLVNPFTFFRFLKIIRK